LCPMAKDFLREYLNLYLFTKFGRDDKRSIQHTLYSVNPVKLMACEYLIKQHEMRNDKIIVFSDNLFALEKMGTMLKRHMIRGDTSHEERLEVLDKFRKASTGFTVFLSKVGDTSIDLPEATVVIQISSQGASRRQEAQRLGRVLRPKGMTRDGVMSGGHAIFYSLVSQDTAEMLYATKRQQFLVNQGYIFNTSTNIPPLEDRADLIFAKPEVQEKLLKEALRDKSEDSPPPVKPPPEKRVHVSSLFKNRKKRN